VMLGLVPVIFCASLLAILPVSRADEGVAAPQPVTITLPPIASEMMWSRLGAEIAYVDLLPDGRIAVLGGKPRGPDGYLRLIDMKTGQETYYYVPDSDGFGAGDSGWAEVAVLENAVFIYSDGSLLRRGTIDRRSATGSSVFPSGHVELDRGAADAAAPGAMVADRNSVLIGWGGLREFDQGDDCGTGPVVVRLSPEGKEIWRWQDATEKFAFPNDITVLADGTILVLVEGDARRPIGMGRNSCPTKREYLVALTPDGHEIARLDLPTDVLPFPLVLNRNGTEVLATHNSPDGNLSAILRIRLEADRILIEPVDIAGKVPGVDDHMALVTGLDDGGYRLIIFPGDVVTLDRDNKVVDRNFPSIARYHCSLRSSRGLVCWGKDRVSVIPLR
jgi:hypothetical protein